AFAGTLAPQLEPAISVPSARYVAGFLIILVGTLIAGGIVSFLISKLVDKTGLSGTDRALGVVFGIIRGIAIVGVLVILARATALPADPWWQESMLLVHFDQLAATVIAYLPPDVAEHFTTSPPE
ncbi:MAG: CvpA family protein, partial [Gammaproteobacteria bacterium]|nr:CvpA family protein [Gammaproteobacteria bacterium]